MRFMVIVKATEDSENGKLPSAELFEAMGKFNEEMVKAGVMLSGEGLLPSARGTRLRFGKDGKLAAVVEGPFPETKELVAGFWIIQTRDRDEAVAWMKRVPGEGMGEIEIRQLAETSDFEDVLSPEARAREEATRATLSKKRD